MLGSISSCSQLLFAVSSLIFLAGLLSEVVTGTHTTVTPSDRQARVVTREDFFEPSINIQRSSSSSSSSSVSFNANDYRNKNMNYYNQAMIKMKMATQPLKRPTGLQHSSSDPLLMMGYTATFITAPPSLRTVESSSPSTATVSSTQSKRPVPSSMMAGQLQQQQRNAKVAYQLQQQQQQGGGDGVVERDGQVQCQFPDRTLCSSRSYRNNEHEYQSSLQRW